MNRYLSYFTSLILLSVMGSCNDRPETTSTNLGLAVYPNPTLNEAHITVRNTSLQLYKLEVFDVKGKLMMEEDVLPGQHDFQIDLHKKPNGYYHVSLITENDVLTQQLLKQ